MNLLLLLVGFRVWSGSPLHVITRVLCAVSVLSLEMQFVTWTGLATVRGLIWVNALLAGALLLWWPERADAKAPSGLWRAWGRYIGVGAMALAIPVAILRVAVPLTAADPYHLVRIAQIERLGTLANDPAADPKVNVLGWLYELMLVDVRQIPLLGDVLVHSHGILGLTLYALTVLALLAMLEASPSWFAVMLFVVPVVFHQFVLIKNDLIGALPAVLVLAWIVARVEDAPAVEFAWAGWLTTLALAIKLTSFPLAVIWCVAIVRSKRGVLVAGAALSGALAGAVAGGLMFTLIENARTYGQALEPLQALGNHTAGPVEAATSLGRFLMSLVDLGLFTRTWWPGRGGWGGTYGLPLIWAVAVLAVCAPRIPAARRALWIAATYWLLFAAVYPDADVAHRLALAPGLLVIAVAVAVAGRGDAIPASLRRLAVPVTVLSAAQIVRGASLYLARL